MDIAFNEISFRPYSESSHALKSHFMQLAKTWKRLNETWDVKHLIFPTRIAELEVLPNTTIHQWLNNLHGLEKAQIINLISRKPFSHEVLEGYDNDIDSFIFYNEQLNIAELKKKHIK